MTQTIKSAHGAEQSLAEFRKHIDAIDERIIALIRERTGIVKQVGELKKREYPGLCPLRPGREAEQVRRVAERFQGTDFSPAAAAAIWRSLIMASLSVEGNISISVCAVEGSQDLYWLAREYFSGFVNIIRQGTPRRVLGDLLDGKAQVCVLPPFTNDDKLRWWPDMIALSAGKDISPRIFAHLPFVQVGKPSRDAARALAVGMIAPENTGNDVSYIAVEAEENTSMHKLQTAFAQAKLQASWIDVAHFRSASRCHVVEVKGFITPEDEAFKAFTAHMGTSLLRSFFLGAYAAPLVIEP